MAHDENFGSAGLCGFLVEFQCDAIEPARAGLFVIVEAKPDVVELADLRVVPTPAEIDDVGYPEGPKLSAWPQVVTALPNASRLLTKKTFTVQTPFADRTGLGV